MRPHHPPDVLAGSEGERRYIDDLEGWFTSYRDVEVERHELEVLLWEGIDCYIGSRLGGFGCVPIPPSRSSYVRGVLTSNIEDCGGRILIYSTTDNPDNVWNIYNLARERGAQAVVFYDYYPGRSRKIVVTGVWGYSFSEGSNVDIPAVHVRLEDGARLRRLVGESVELYVESSSRLSRGVSLKASIYGREDRSIAVVGHHDRWFDGFRDNQISIEIMKTLTRRVLGRSTKPRYSLELISFTAEEFGDPRLASWYWGYGSRRYVEAGGISDETLYAVVLDTVFMEPVRIKYNYPDPVVGALNRYRFFRSLVEGYGHAFTDAASLNLAGVPLATLYNLEDMYDVYHTDLDREFQHHEISTRIAAWIADALGKHAGELLAGVGRVFIRDIEAKLPNGYKGLAERLLEKALDIDSLRCVLRSLVKPALIGDFRDLYNDIELTPLPEADALRLYEEGSSMEVWVCGYENRKIYDPGYGYGRSHYLGELERALEDIRLCVKS